MENNWFSQMAGVMPSNRGAYGFAPHYEIVQVNGRAGAENFRMGPNSNYLLLDNTAPIIWFVKTDGTGLLTVTPFDYSPHQDAPPVDLNDLQQRLTQLEARVNERSNTGTNKQQHRSSNSSNAAKQQPAEGTV